MVSAVGRRGRSGRDVGRRTCRDAGESACSGTVRWGTGGGQGSAVDRDLAAAGSRHSGQTAS